MSGRIDVGVHHNDLEGFALLSQLLEYYRPRRIGVKRERNVSLTDLSRQREWMTKAGVIFALFGDSQLRKGMKSGIRDLYLEIIQQRHYEEDAAQR